MHIHLENTQNVKEVWKMNKIRVLIVKPNQEPKQMKIEHTLDKLQNIVGGLIEYVDLDYQTDLICNEEGKLLGEAKDNTLYIVLQKDGEYLKFDEYFKKD